MIQDKYTVTEGLNNTVLLCAALMAGSLEKPVMLNLESEGKYSRKCEICIFM